MPPAGDRKANPTLSRRRLGHELRQLREASNLTMRDVAAHLYCSTSKVSRMETGRVAATVRDVRDMLELYNANDQQRELLLQLARDARQRETRWHEYGDIPDAREFMQLEDAAESLSIYEPLLVPGLLQSEEYTRLILRAIYPDLQPQEIERYVQLRRVRQAILIREEPVILEVVIDEAALHRLLGARPVMNEQISKLFNACHLPNLTFQVLGFNAGIHAGMTSPFTILRFPDQADPDVVLLEHSAGNLYLTSPGQVERYRMRFERLQAMALSPRDSEELLRNLLDAVR